MRRSHLPILDPCGEDWSAMHGDERRRRCASCDREVLHLSAMTVEEARGALAARAGERVCVRYAYDEHDDIVFARRPGGLRAAALASALAACAASEVEVPHELPDESGPAQVEPSEQCEQVEPPIVADEAEAGQCDPPPELEGMEVDVEVTPVRRGEVGEVVWSGGHVTMGVPAARAVAPPPVPVPVVMRPATQARPSGRRLPLDAQMGALPPDVLVALPPSRRDEDG